MWLTALAGARFGVEVVVRWTLVWFAQALTGGRIEVESASAVLVSAHALTVHKLLTFWASSGHAYT